LVAGDGKVYFTSDDTPTTVVRQGPEHKVLATKSIDGPVSASMVAADGQLFLRGNSHLYCIGTRR
jgi:outer membrane protein assembly factor BamB